MGKSVRHLTMAGLVAVVMAAAGCQEDEPQRVSLFEQAETHYQRGEYEAALDDYQAFVERTRQSPLVETAKTRMRTINREIESIMGRNDMPPPAYVGDETNDRHADRTVQSGTAAEAPEAETGDDTESDSTDEAP